MADIGDSACLHPTRHGTGGPKPRDFSGVLPRDNQGESRIQIVPLQGCISCSLQPSSLGAAKHEISQTRCVSWGNWGFSRRLSVDFVPAPTPHHDASIVDSAFQRAHDAVWATRTQNRL